MLKTAMALVFAIALVAPFAAQADPPTPPAVPSGAMPAKPNDPVSQSKISGYTIAICYTCGGCFSRHVATKSLGGFNYVYEWGSRCSGGQAYRRDSNPYFCAYSC